MLAAWYTDEELQAIGFGALGEDVKIDSSVVIVNPSNIFIKNHVRIDSFCFLGAGQDGIHIGSHVHLAASVFIFGGGGKVVVEDFSGLAARVSLYTANDDYSGEFMTNPTVPDAYKNVEYGPVFIGRHVIVGTGSVIMPNVRLSAGIAVAAMSYINKSLGEFTVVSGKPAKILGKRHRGLLAQEQQFLAHSLSADAPSTILDD